MKKQIEITEEQASDFYKDPEGFKKMLEANFTKEQLIKKDWKNIKTLEDAAEVTGHKSGYLKMQDPESLDEWAYRMLKMVAKAINKDWVPDWSNTNQRKWYPWFDISPSGAGFSGSAYLCTYAVTGVGSRLCFETEEKSDYVGKQFIKIYNQFLL